MAIVLECELMEPEDVKDNVSQHGGVHLRSYRWLKSTPGDGEICLFSFPDIDRAFEFLVSVFGEQDDDTYGGWTLKEVVPGAFYSHSFN